MNEQSNPHHHDINVDGQGAHTQSLNPGKDAVAPLPRVATETVELDTPLARGKTTVTEIHVRKPKSGALRGVALTDVLQMDVQALTKVLPRITEPALTEPELRDMDPADLVQLGTVVANFLLPKRMQADAET